MKFTNQNIIVSLVIKIFEITISWPNSVEDWNCNDCSFQANCASELLKHLKLSAHQPSKNNEVKQCYTCKLEFEGYFNLMNHRKISHPSSKKCRNFPGNCQHGNQCWYVHEDKMDTGEEDAGQGKSLPYTTCNICQIDFQDKRNFMKHMKSTHRDVTKKCRMYDDGQCTRNTEECWFIHSPPEKNNSKQQSDPHHKQDFQEPSASPFPPDQMSKLFWMVTNLCSKVQNIEKKFEDLMI